MAFNTAESFTQNKSNNKNDNQQNLSVTPIDIETYKGRIQWEPITQYFVPTVIRVINDVRLQFISAQMAENSVLHKYLINLHSDILTYASVKCHLMTRYEANMLNKINKDYCDSKYGENLFSKTESSKIVLFEDLCKLVEFLEFCYRKIFYDVNQGPNDKCGFIQLTVNNLVPYIIINNIKYVPQCCFEIKELVLSQLCTKIICKDLSFAYIKFCCNVENIIEEFQTSDSCQMISFNDIKRYYTEPIHCEEFWPHYFDKNRFINNTIDIPSGTWMKALDNISATESITPHISTTSVIIENKSVITNSHRIQADQMATAIVPQSNDQTNSCSSTSNLGCISQLPPPPPAVPIIYYDTITNNNIMPNSDQLHQNFSRCSSNSQDQQQHDQQQQLIITTPRINRTQINRSTVSEVVNSTTPLSIPAPITQQDTTIHTTTNMRLKRSFEQSLYGTSKNKEYQIYVTEIDGKKFKCINSKPHDSSVLMISLEYLFREQFPMGSVKKCAVILQEQLNITLTKANKNQLTLLFIQKCDVLKNPEYAWMVCLEDLKPVFRQLKSLMNMN